MDASQGISLQNLFVFITEEFLNFLVQLSILNSGENRKERVKKSNKFNEFKYFNEIQ